MWIIFFIAVIMVFYLSKQCQLEKKEKERMKMLVDKDEMIILTLLQWVKIGHEKKKIETILREMNCKVLAIYGYGHLGKLLADTLDKDEVTVIGFIDKNKKLKSKDFSIYSPDEPLPEMDSIVVTSVYFFDEIEEELSQLLPNVKILSLYDILYQL